MLKKIGKWNILIIAVVLGLILSFLNFYKFNPAREYVSTVISFVYDGAQTGNAPDGQALSMDVIKSKDLLEKTIESQGLSSIIDADDLAANIVIRGSYPDDIIDQIMSFDSLLTSDPTRVVKSKDYSPTTYRIIIYNELSNKLSQTQLKGLLSALVNEYKDQYVRLYGAGIDWSAVNDLFAAGEHDYAQIIRLLSTKVGILKNYSDLLYQAQPAWMCNGTSFNALSLRCSSIIDNDLQSLSANITINAVSRDAERLMQQYKYEAEQLEYELTALEESYERINALIDSYEMDGTLYLTSGSEVITVTGNSKETYEQLVEERTRLSGEIASIESKIGDYQSRAEDLSESIESEDQHDYTAVVEAALRSVEEKIELIMKDFEALSEEYNKEFVSATDIRSSSVIYYGNRLKSSSFVRTVIKSEAPLCLLALAIILIIGLVQKRKKTAGA